MDAATAAAMSDPDENRWFRRRWVEVAALPVQINLCAEPFPEIDFGRLGHELLAAWRRERAFAGPRSR